MQKQIKILVIILFFSTLNIYNSSAQIQNDTIEYQEVPLQYFDHARTGFIPDTLAKYPLGYYGVQTHIAKNIRYPVDAASTGKKGRVIVSFSVNIDGTIDEVIVTQSVFKSIDKEAIRVIKTMKGWKPAIKEGKPVKVYYKAIVTFKNMGVVR